MRGFHLCGSSIGLACCGVRAAAASVTIFAGNNNLAAFNLAAGTPPVALDFDSIPADTNIGGLSVDGVTLTGPGAPLLVVVGSSTVTPAGFTGVVDANLNRLLPTSGEHVLSPGGLLLAPGPNAPLENDDLTLVFDPPVAAFGIDHISQSADGFSFTTVTVLDPNNAVLFSGSIPVSNLGGGGGAPAGADFWGVVSTAPDIRKVVFNEQDEDSLFPDCNIGFDSVRFFPTAACGGSPDINGDGVVNGADLAALLGQWLTSDCAADLDGSGVVNGADLAMLLGSWTP